MAADGILLVLVLVLVLVLETANGLMEQSSVGVLNR